MVVTKWCRNFPNVSGEKITTHKLLRKVSKMSRKDDKNAAIRFSKFLHYLDKEITENVIAIFCQIQQGFQILFTTVLSKFMHIFKIRNNNKGY